MDRVRVHIALSVLVLSSLLVGCSTVSEDAIAVVDDRVLTVEEAAQLLAPHEGFANVAESVRSLAEMWIEFVAVGQAFQEDPTLAGVDVSPILEVQARQPSILALRDQVIEADTALTPEAVYDAYLEENPGTRVRAHHILLTLPPGAPASERDTLRAVGERLREQIARGGDFEALARGYSGDPATADAGGDLGEFGRGEMVPEFEDAVFSLEEGELSGVVETGYGFHIIRLDERVDPEFEEVQDQVRAREQNRIQSRAESIYLEEVEESVDLRLVDGAVDRFREIASNPGLEPSGAGEALVEYSGGEVTAGELREYLLLQPREVAVQVRTTDAAQLEQLLRNLARQEVMLLEAERLEVAPQEPDRLATAGQIRQQASVAAATIGLARVIEETGSVTEAARRTLVDVLRGDQQMMSFGPAVGALRLAHDTQVFPERFARVVSRVAEIRSSPDYEPFTREAPEAASPQAPQSSDGALPATPDSDPDPSDTAPSTPN